MIFGEYPCCGENYAMAIPEGVKLPAFCKENCQACGTLCWHRISRTEPMSWTETEFLKEFTVDLGNNIVRPIKCEHGGPFPDFIGLLMESIAEEIAKRTGIQPPIKPSADPLTAPPTPAPWIDKIREAPPIHLPDQTKDKPDAD